MQLIEMLSAYSTQANLNHIRLNKALHEVNEIRNLDATVDSDLRSNSNCI